MNNIQNPMLEDDYDDEGVAVIESANPYAPIRTPEDQAEVDAKKVSGDVSDGRKKNYKNPTYKRSRLTDKDAVLLAFLAKFKIATTEQLSLLLKVDDPKHPNFGKLISVATAKRRLYGLQEAGAVEMVSYRGYEPMWQATKFGVFHAEMSGLVGDAWEVDPSYRNPLNLSELPHTLGVNQIAACLASPAQPMKKVYGVASFTELNSEYQVRAPWAEQVQNLGEKNKGAGTTEEFVTWRNDTIRRAHREIAGGLAEWRYLVEDHPEFFTIGLTTDLGKVRKKHHHPDLVINKEHTRNSAKAVSTAIEIERNVKTGNEYRLMVDTWVAEFSKSNETPVYRAVIYNTNREAAIKAIRRADRNVGLEKSGRLIFAPIRHRDGSLVNMSGVGGRS